MGSTTSTQKTESSPPAWSKGLYSQSASDAQKLYDSGAGGNVYQGDTTAGLGTTTQNGISGVQSTVNNLSGTTSSATNLADMASGNYLKNGNPYFEQALQGQLDNTAAQVQSQFSGSGRYGSAANTNALTTQLGNIRSNALYNQYNQDAQNMLSANSAIDSANSTNFQNQLAGNQAVISAGQLQDAAKQADLDAAQNKWTAEDNQGWTRLGLLQSAAAGSSGNYGSNVATTTQSPNLLSTIGGIGATAAKSDIRLKENIIPVGEKNGFSIYEWNYTGRPERYRGVMAQDVQKVRPDAVVLENDGYLAVYYDKIGIQMERVN